MCYNEYGGIWVAIARNSEWNHGEEPPETGELVTHLTVVQNLYKGQNYE